MKMPPTVRYRLVDYFLKSMACIKYCNNFTFIFEHTKPKFKRKILLHEGTYIKHAINTIIYYVI